MFKRKKHPLVQKNPLFSKEHAPGLEESASKEASFGNGNRLYFIGLKNSSSSPLLLHL
jgi:hypothetical protein